MDDKLVAKVNNIDSNRFVLKTNLIISDVDKIPDTSGLGKKIIMLKLLK